MHFRLGRISSVPQAYIVYKCKYEACMFMNVCTLFSATRVQRPSCAQRGQPDMISCTGKKRIICVRFPMLAPGHVLGYHVVFPVSSQSAMTRVEPQRETNSSRERRLPPLRLADVHVALRGFRETSTGCSFFIPSRRRSG